MLKVGGFWGEYKTEKEVNYGIMKMMPFLSFPGEDNESQSQVRIKHSFLDFDPNIWLAADQD